MAFVMTAALVAGTAQTGPAVAADGPNPAEPQVAAGKGDDSERIPDRYLAVFGKHTSIEHIRGLEREVKARGGKIHAEYTEALRGFGATLPKAALASVKSDPQLRFVEPDRTLGITSTQTPVPSWGLDRVDQRPRQLDGRYGYSATGLGVTVFVVDTGIRASHRDFRATSAQPGGRIAPGFSAIGDGRGTDDCNGHGTHTAATIGGTNFGVAKQATLVPVRVLGCGGGGNMISLVDGLDWVAAQVSANPTGSFVANMSLGQSGSAVIDQAVQTAINLGVTFVAAAGNENGNACIPSPGRLPDVLTVGATTRNDDRASSFSNFGSCVDVWAPGADITSAYNSSDTSTYTLSGTSMAAPHVAGAAALYLQRFPAAKPAEVRNAVTSTATSGVLKNLGSGSPNKLLFAAGLGGVPNRGPSMGTPVPALSAGQATAAGAVPVKVTSSVGIDPDGNAFDSSEWQLSRDGGSTWSDVQLPSTRATAVTLRIPATSALRFRARAFDSLGTAGDWVTSPSRSLAVRNQDSGAKFAKTGRWRTARSGVALGGSVRSTSRKGAAATFTFVGRQGGWIATMAKNRGRAAVYVDGRKIGVYDLYSRSVASRRTVFFVTGLSSGKHTVKIVVLGTAHRRAKGHAVEVDGWSSLS